MSPSTQNLHASDTILTQLNYYQEQPYLLDPYLERLLVPVVDKFRIHASAAVSDPKSSVSSSRLIRIAELLYNYIKFRGYKTISEPVFHSRYVIQIPS